MAKSTPTNFDPTEEPKASAAKTAAPKATAAPVVEHTTYPGQTLGIVALVLAFFLPVPALALGIIAWVWSNKAGKNNVLAKVSVFVSGAFAVIGIFLFGLWIAFASAFAGGLYGGHLPGDRVISGSYQIMPGEVGIGGMKMPGDMDDMMRGLEGELGGPHGGHMMQVPTEVPSETPSATTN